MSEEPSRPTGTHMYVEQLRYFFENLGRDDIENNLLAPVVSTRR